MTREQANIIRAILTEKYEMAISIGRVLRDDEDKVQEWVVLMATAGALSALIDAYGDAADCGRMQ